MAKILQLKFSRGKSLLLGVGLNDHFMSGSSWGAAWEKLQNYIALERAGSERHKKSAEMSFYQSANNFK